MLEQPTTSAMNAVAEASDENPNPFAMGRGGKNLKFKAKSGGGFEVVVDSDGAGKSDRD